VDQVLHTAHSQLIVTSTHRPTHRPAHHVPHTQVARKRSAGVRVGTVQRECTRVCDAGCRLLCQVRRANVCDSLSSCLFSRFCSLLTHAPWMPSLPHKHTIAVRQVKGAGHMVPKDRPQHALVPLPSPFPLPSLSLPSPFPLPATHET
jgi:hypothetical protein